MPTLQLRGRIGADNGPERKLAGHLVILSQTIIASPTSKYVFSVV